MKKKIVLFLMMLCSVFGVISCGNNDLYANMTITRVGGNDTPIQLMIEKEGNVYNYKEVSFDIKVTGDKDVDLGVNVGSGRGFLATSSEYKGDGITTVTAHALSPAYNGPFSLEITTAVGNKSISVPFDIGVKINSFDFIDKSLVAVRKGDAIDLTKLNEFISFDPVETTQRNLTFSVVMPDEIVDDENNPEFKYELNKEEDGYGKYAKVIDNRILQTYTEYIDSEGKSQAPVYPQVSISLDENNQIVEERIRLKAVYDVGGDNNRENDIVKTIDIKVLDDCTNINLSMNKKDVNEYLQLTDKPGEDYEYDVVLTTPLFDEDFKYNYERTLKITYTTINSGGNGNGEGPKTTDQDFEVVSLLDGVEVENISLSAKKCVTIFPSGDVNSFVVTSTSPGKYSHTFLLRHKEYPTVIAHKIIVNFEVLELPSSVYVNDSEYSSEEYIVCDNYPGPYGAGFNIKLGNNEQNLSGVFRDTDYYVSVLSNSGLEGDNLIVNKKGSSANLARAIITQNDTLDNIENAESFGNGSTFYLKHKFEKENKPDYGFVYITVVYSLAANSYNSDLKDNFIDQFVRFPVKLLFVNTIDKFIDIEAGDKATVYLDTTNYASTEVKLCSLPLGMAEKDVVQSVNFDDSLISVYSRPDENGAITYFAKAIKQVREKTRVVFEAKNNGLIQEVDIELYMTSSYSGNEYPMDVEITSSSSSYLYYVTEASLVGAAPAPSPEPEPGISNVDVVYDNENPHQETNTGKVSYESVHAIFMHVNSTINIGIYDFIGTEKYSIIEDCDVDYDRNYLAYSAVDTRGVITARGIPASTTITISYDIYELGDNGVEIKEESKTIYIYILNNMRNLTTNTDLNNSLFVDDYLGYFDRNSASVKTITTNFNKLSSIGTEWNSIERWKVANNNGFVNLQFRYNLNESIVDSSGNQIVIYSESGTKQHNLKYSDLFEITTNNNELTIKCKITGDLYDFLNDSDNFNSLEAPAQAVRNALGETNITLQVDIIANQFNYSRVVGTRSFIACMPNMNTGFNLDIDEDGVYKELTEKEFADVERIKIKIYYTLNNVNASNKELVIIENKETDEYVARIVQTNYGNAGYIEITPKAQGFKACVYNIKITTKDNVSNYVSINNGTGIYSVYSDNTETVKSFRIKFADGSELYPFEISNIDDFKGMIEKTQNKYYHYVLTEDLDLISYSDFAPIDLVLSGETFSLTGKHSYVYNGNYYEKYSTIYNLRIYRDLSDISTDVNIGLFGKILGDSQVYITDLAVKDAIITIVDNKDNFDGNLSVGILAGNTNGRVAAASSISGVIALDVTNNCIISNCSVSGSISINIDNFDGNDKKAYVGGMIGWVEDTDICGKPSTFVESISSTGDNVNVYINVVGNDACYNIGGLAGYLVDSTIEDVQVVSSIIVDGSVVGSIGGVVGVALVSTISLVKVSPRINVNSSSILSYGFEIGGVAGDVYDSNINYTKAYFVNIGNGYDADEKLNISIVAVDTSAYVGGLVGRALYTDAYYGEGISYSYVRSFYNNQEMDDSYHGNIYVDAGYGSLVGGLIGLIDGGEIKYSYFDGDILLSGALNNDPTPTPNVKGGLIVGDFAAMDISNCYAVGLLYRLTDNELVIARGVTDYTNIFGVAFTYTMGEGYTYNIMTDSSIVNTFAVVNQNVAFITKSTDADTIFGYYESGKALSQMLGVSVKNALTTAGFTFVDGNSLIFAEGEGKVGKWFYNSNYKINTIEFNEIVDGLPILIDDNGKAMYDLIPTGIGVNIKAGTKYNISHNGKTQLLMFINENPCYEIKYNDNSKTIDVYFNDQVISTTYVTIPLNTNIEFVINDGEREDVLRIIGNKIYAKNTGRTTLIVRSSVDKTVATKIEFCVVNGVTQLTLKDTNNKTYASTGNNLYIDEVNTMYISSNENAKDELMYLFVLTDGKITLNELELEKTSQDIVVLLDDKQLDIVGKVMSDSVSFKIIPCIKLIDINYVDSYLGQSYNNILILEDSDIVKTYRFTTVGRAISLENDVDNAKVPVSGGTLSKLNIVTTNVDGNVINENVKFTFDNGTVCTFDSLQAGSYFTHELIKFTIDSVDISDDLGGGKYSCIISYSITFMEDVYYQNAESYDLNNCKYNVYISIDTNSLLGDNLTLVIAPRELKTILTNYYPRTTRSGSFYQISNDTNASKSIIYGQDGILKVTLDEKLNDSGYITVLLPESVRGYVRIDQMTGIYEPGEIVDTFRYSGNNFNYTYDSASDSYFGIRLRKVSETVNSLDYYNHTYYVKLSLINRLTSIDEIEVLIQSYKIGENEPYVSTSTTLTVASLPEVDVTIAAKTDVEKTVIGKGVKKQLNIDVKNTTNDIVYNISTGKTENIGKVTIKRYQKILDKDVLVNANGVLDIDYINGGGVYYLCVDVSSELDAFSITFFVNEVVLGVQEVYEDILAMQIVEYEISAIKFDSAFYEGDYTNAYFEIAHGQSVSMDINIEYKDIEIGDEDEIIAYKETLDALFINNSPNLTNKELLELQLSYSTIQKGGSDVDPALVYNERYFYYLNSESITDQYSPMGLNETINNVKLSTFKMINGDYTYLSTYMIGMILSSDNKFKLEFTYYYDNGILKVANDAVGTRYGVEIFITVNVKDNSTYDHPVPIESEEEFIKACQSENGEGEFILIDNIELSSWKPIDANFKSLDGNGYKFIIKSFDLSDFRGENTANVGIFSTVSSKTLLKNIAVDISQLLVTENTFNNNISKLNNSTSEETFIHGEANIDLSYIPTVNFGVIAGTNYGTITNAKVINTSNSVSSIYLHVLTNQEDGKSTYTSNIGTLVGVNASVQNQENSSSGAITNSFAGMSKTGKISLVNVSASTVVLENKDDTLNSSVATYPFTLVGGNNIAGLVAKNEAIIASSYTRGLGLYNVYQLTDNSMTGGLVADNAGVISSSFIEGQGIARYRAVADDFMLESKGHVGGLVYTNSGKIENSYSNVYIENLSAFSGAFVFENSGEIINSYTAGTARSDNSYGDFTGTINSVLQNTGTYTNCYYLVLDGESINSNEDANALEEYNGGEVAEGDNKVTTFNEKSNWQGFVFASSVNSHNGIWTLSTDKNALPQLVSTSTETVSFRYLSDVSFDIVTPGFEENHVYYYTDKGPTMGSAANPLIISTAENFVNYILDTRNTSNNVNDKNIRIVNNLDFSDFTMSDIYDGEVSKTYLYEIAFSGVLEGNGMTLENVHLETSETNLGSFGIFGTIKNGVVKNLNITVGSYAVPSTVSAGVLAGNILNNSIIANVSVNGNNKVNNGQNSVVIRATNLSGGIAGIVSNSQLHYITISDIALESRFSSISESLNILAEHNNKFNKFTIKNIDGSIIASDVEFLSRSDRSNFITNLSYSGGVAGIIEGGSAENILVHNSFYISQADMSGGIAGYLGEGSTLTNAKFEVSEKGQLIKGICYAGGLVGENRGIITRSYIEHDEERQNLIDESITKNERELGVMNLFSLISTYNVAIGGIAGYSKGTIEDCYSKVNVIDENSYIAGGLVGYGDIGNTIKRSYTIGIVFSREIIGGIIGFQNANNPVGGHLTSSLNMEKVVGLTDWNSRGEEKGVDYRNEITARLFRNSMGYYRYNKSGSSDYYKFFIKMPEIGNQATSIHDGVLTTYNYQLDHDRYYVGSAIGKVYIDEENLFVSDSIITDLRDSNACKAVFSNTLGMYTSSGNLVDRNRKDNFNSSNFSLLVNDSKYSIYSYRIAYQPIDYRVINQYVDKSGYEDFFSYLQVFDGQEYAQQLIGTYAEVVVDSDSGDKLNKFTTNVFEQDYEIFARFGIGSSPVKVESSFIGDKTEHELSNWVMGDYNLPKFRTKRENIFKISDSDEFIIAVRSNSKGATYELESPEYEITIERDVDETLVPIWQPNNIQFSLMGNPASKPKIIFNISSSSNIATIFNGFDDVSWANINFVINVLNIPTIVGRDEKFGPDFGIFANILNNSNFKNCDFEINVGTVNASTSFKTELEGGNIGTLIGRMKSSYIEKSKVTIEMSNVEITRSDVNFGFITGISIMSYLKNVDLEIDNITIKVSPSVNNVSVGTIGLLGSASALQSITTNANTITINDNSSQKGDINISAIAGCTNNDSTLYGIVNRLNIMYTDGSSGYVEKSINVGMIAGKANNSLIIDDSINTSTGTLKVVGKNDIYAGGIVGYSEILSLTKVGNFATIDITGASAKDLFVGGVIGNSQNTLTINTAFNIANIKANNQNPARIGGMIGYSNNSMHIENVVVVGDLYITGSNIDNSYMGGIVGERNTSCSIDLSNFSVLSDFTGNVGNINNIGGIVSSSNNYDKLQGGYVYSETHKLNGDNVYALIKRDSSNRASYNNVYYAQEFATKNYTKHDSYFGTYVIADLHDTINGNSNILNVRGEKAMVIAKGLGNVELLIPKTIAEMLDSSNTLDDLKIFITDGTKHNLDTHKEYVSKHFEKNKFNLQEFKADMLDGSNAGYYVVKRDINLNDTLKTSVNDVISGRTKDDNKNEKYEISINTIDGDTDVKYFFEENKGVISNLYFRTMTEDKDARNVALCNINYGLITDVMLYGETTTINNSEVSAFVSTNSGKIYKSVSSYIAVGYTENISITLYAFAKDNTDGIIDDVYSNSFGYYEHTKYTIKISNKFGNNRYVIVPHEVSNLCAVYSSSQSSDVSNRPNIWAGTLIKGFTLKTNNISVVICYNGVDIGDANGDGNVNMGDFDYLVENDNGPVDERYVFTYKLLFYQDSVLTYGNTEVRLIFNDNEFDNWINSDELEKMDNQYFIKHKIILLVSTNGGSFTFSSERCSNLIVSPQSAIIGIYKFGEVVTNKKVSLSFDKDWKDIKTIEEHLFYKNSGLIINLSINYGNRSLDNITPIKVNDGIIANVWVGNFRISVANTPDRYFGVTGSVGYKTTVKFGNWILVGDFSSSAMGLIKDCSLFAFTITGYNLYGKKVKVYSVDDITETSQIKYNEIMPPYLYYIDVIIEIVG